MGIYTVYVDLKEGASPDDYFTLKRLMLKEFRVSPITIVGQLPVYFSPLFSPAATYSAEGTYRTPNQGIHEAGSPNR
jgi:hypothetical protein